MSIVIPYIKYSTIFLTYFDLYHILVSIFTPHIESFVTVEQVKQKIVHRWSVARDPANINAKIYAHTLIYSLEDQLKHKQH